MSDAVNLPLLASLAAISAAAVALVDGRRSVLIATAIAAAGLAPTALAAAGLPGAVVIVAAAPVAIVTALLAGRVAGALPWVNGLDPEVPVYAGREPLFGPRSVRAAGAALLLPVASWVSFNVAAGTETAVSGILFPATYVALCGVLRVFLARTVEDLGVGLSAVGLAVATGWLLRDGAAGLGPALLPAALSVIATVAVGWMHGRSARRQAGTAA